MEFSEELKQIVRETKGQWKEKAKGIVYSKNDPSGKVGMAWVYSAEGLDHAFWCCEDNIEHKVVLRPEFEACLMEMTGRPKVEDWPEWAVCVTQDADGRWTAWIYAGQAVVSDDGWYEKPKYDLEIEHNIGKGSPLNWRRSLMTKDEALERERIISQGDNITVEVSDDQGDMVELQEIISLDSVHEFTSSMAELIKQNVDGIADYEAMDLAKDMVAKASGFTGNSKGAYLGKEHVLTSDVKTSETQARDNLEASDIEVKVINSTGDEVHCSKDWFRNGEIPPAGEEVVSLVNQETYIVKAVSGRNVWLFDIIDKEFVTGEIDSILPADYDIDKLHGEALIENEKISEIAKMRGILLDRAIDLNDGDIYSFVIANNAAATLYYNGCRLHPELAQ